MFVGTRRSYIHSTARQAHRKRPDTGRAGKGRAHIRAGVCTCRPQGQFTQKGRASRMGRAAWVW